MQEARTETLDGLWPGAAGYTPPPPGKYPDLGGGVYLPFSEEARKDILTPKPHIRHISSQIKACWHNL